MNDRDDRLRVRDLVDDEPGGPTPRPDLTHPDAREPRPDAPAPAATLEDPAVPQIPQVVVEAGGGDDKEGGGSPLPFDPFIVLIGVRRRIPMMVAVFLVIASLGLPAALAVRTHTWQVYASILRKSEQKEYLVTGNQPIVKLQIYPLPTLLRMVKVSENLETAMAEADLAGEDPNEISAAVLVSNPKDTQIIEIIFQWEDPQVAVAFVNSLSRVFIEYVDRLQKLEAIQGYDYLSAELGTVRARIAEYEDELVRFKTEHEAVKLSDQAGTIVKQVAEFDVLARQEALDAAMAEQVLEAAAAEMEWAEPTVISATFVKKPLHTRLVQLEADLAGLLSVYTEEAPVVRETRDEIERTRELIRRDLEKELEESTVSRNPILASLEQTLVDQRLEIAQRRARAEGYESMLAQFRARLKELPALESRFADLSQRLQTLRDVEAILAKRVEEVRIIRDSTASNLSIMQEAKVPKWPLPSKAKLVLAAFVLLGGAVAVGLGLGLEIIDFRLKAASELPAALGVPALGEIPSLPAEQVLLRGLEDHPALETYRALATSVLLQKPEDHRGGWSLMITGADHFEGRTTVAANLAQVIAARGWKVCLVDTDLTKPDLSELALRHGQRMTGPGLGGVLSGSATLDQAVVGPTETGVAWLPVGDTRGMPAERLGTTAFAEMLDGLRKRFDLILVDTTPVLTGTAPLLVAPFVDGALYIAEAFALNRSGHREVRERLGGTGVPIIGAALNKVRRAYARPFAVHRYATRAGGRHAA